jgi:2'-5' RNA ligase
MKRIFIAIPFKEDLLDYLANVQMDVENLSESGKYTKKENFHLTIEFIGMVPEKLIAPLWREVSDAVEGVAPFKVTLDHMGQFIKKNRSIPWVGLEGSDALVDLQNRVVQAVAKVVAHNVDHPYRPHITLGRRVVIQDLPLLKEKKVVLVDEIALMESSSKSGQLLYTPLYIKELT